MRIAGRRIMRAPAILITVPFIVGSAASIVLFDSLDPSTPLICAAAALLTLIAAVSSFGQNDWIDATAAIVIGAGLSGFSLGATAAAHAYHPPLLRWFDTVMSHDPVMLEGVLREDASLTPFGVSLTVDVLSVQIGRRGIPQQASPAMRGGVRVSIGGELLGTRIEQWRAGRRIRMPALLRRPSVYLNPGTPDERRALARRGVVLVGSVKSAALVEMIRRGNFLAESAAAIRASTRTRVARYVGRLDAKSGGVTTAVLIGDRSGLAADDERRLQEAGTYHVIAISGGNIAILAILIVSLGRLVMIPLRGVAIVTSGLLLFYGVIAGGAASVARAVTVAVLVLCARALDHRGPPLNALAVAALIAVASTPVVVLDPGFALSFGATLGILIGVPSLVPSPTKLPRSRLRRAGRRVLLPFTTLAAATACAELALAPVVATLFSRVSFAGLVLNFAAIPLMTVVQVSGLIVTFTASWCEMAARLSGTGAHLAAAGLLRSAYLVDVAPWLSIDVPPPSLWFVAAYYSCVGGLFVSRIRGLAAMSLVIAAGLILVGPRATARDAVSLPALPLRVVVLDVGQGDASVVLLPDAHAVLVDAGGLTPFSTTPEAFEVSPGFDIGERVVTPALRALGVRRAHAFVMTHGDPDHILGVRGVLRHVRTDSMWEGIPVPPHPGLKVLFALASEKSIPWRTVQAGDAERFGEVEIRVLHPPPPDWERQRVRNEDSVVLEVRFGRVSIMLPGDIGKEGEHAIMRRLEPGRLVILKAPHHGSATSSTQELLDLLRPQAVIFSCGRENRFGHPHPAVVARYRAMRSEIFSTAEDGAVFVETDGTKVEVWGWSGRRRAFRGGSDAVH
jgi:competence protein ComEC